MQEWVPIPGWEGFYEITRTGRVRSLDRMVHSTMGRKYLKRGKELESNSEKTRYVGFILNDGTRHTRGNLHRLLAETFIPNPNNLPEVRHLNDDPRDNRLENLAWGTHYDNMQDIKENKGHHNSNKTHCKRGHEFSEGNTYSAPNEGRVCKTCRDARVKGHYEKYANTEPKEHGTMSGYKVHRCRCELCKKANTDYCREARERRRIREDKKQGSVVD